MRLRRSAAALVFLVTLMFVGGALASERGADEVSRITTRLSQEIYSPYCPGKTLAMCPSSGAQDARMEIQELASQGMAEQEIKATLLARFGEEYELIEPPARDNMTLLGALFAGFSLAIGAVFFLTRRRRSDGGEIGSDDAGSEEDDDVEGELFLEELRAEYLD